MIVPLRTERTRTLDQLRAFLDGNESADFELTDRTSAYAFVRRTLVRFEYHGLGRPYKTRVKRFLEKVTGFSKAQVTRLIRQHRRNGHIREHRKNPPAKAVDMANLGSPDPAFNDRLKGSVGRTLRVRPQGWRMTHYGREASRRDVDVSALARGGTAPFEPRLSAAMVLQCPKSVAAIHNASRDIFRVD